MHQVVAILLFLSYSVLNCIRDEPYLNDSCLRHKWHLNYRKRMSEKQLYCWVHSLILRPIHTNVSSILTVSAFSNTVGTETTMITSKPLSMVNEFEGLDLSESRSSQYIEDTSHTILKDYANEKVCFTWLLGDYAQDLPVSHYSVSRSLVRIVFIPRCNRLYCQEFRFYQDYMQVSKDILFLPGSVCGCRQFQNVFHL